MVTPSQAYGCSVQNALMHDDGACGVSQDCKALHSRQCEYSRVLQPQGLDAEVGGEHGLDEVRAAGIQADALEAVPPGPAIACPPCSSAEGGVEWGWG